MTLPTAAEIRSLAEQLMLGPIDALYPVDIQAAAFQLHRLADLIEEREAEVRLLKAARKYVEQAHHQAEGRHDNPEGEYYMDGVQYEIMEDTQRLLSEIDALISPTRLALEAMKDSA